MQISRRRVIAGAGAIAAAPWLGNASAQAFPSRPVKIVVPWPAGGPADGVLRPVCEKLTASTGQAWILESEPGANGTIGTARVAKAPPDGYTLIQSHVGPMAINPAMMKLPYDPIKGFVPITQLTSTPLVMVVRPDLPIRNVAEYLAYAKSRPEPLNFGNIGNGSTGHILAEMIRLATGLKYVNVAYKGSDPVVLDMIGGRLDYTFVNYGGIKSHVESGKLRVIGVTSLKRTATLPSVPPVADTIPGIELTAWFGLHAPAGTPKAIVDRIHDEVTKVLRMPEITDRLNQGNFDVEATTSEQFQAKVLADTAKFAKVVQATGMTMG